MGGQQGHSQVEAEVLLLLEEVVEDELAQKVRVQGVVDDLGPAKLGDMGTPGRHVDMGMGTWGHGNMGTWGHRYEDVGT